MLVSIKRTSLQADQHERDTWIDTMMDLSSVGVVFLVVRTSGYFFLGVRVNNCTFSSFLLGMAPEVEPNFPSQHFPTESVLTVGMSDCLEGIDPQECGNANGKEHWFQRETWKTLSFRWKKSKRSEIFASDLQKLAWEFKTVNSIMWLNTKSNTQRYPHRIFSHSLMT